VSEQFICRKLSAFSPCGFLLTFRGLNRTIYTKDSISRMNETKEKILDTAERLIGEQGYAATSLRQVIATAGVNLAAVHYHFGSKEELLDAVVSRKVTPVNEARIAMLERVEAESADGPPEVEKVLEAFFLPTAEVASRSPEFVRLMGRMHAEGMLPQVAAKHFRTTGMRFVDALQRAMPDLPQRELLWRVHFMIGAMAHTMCVAPNFPLEAEAGTDVVPRMRRLVTFLSAGFRAPATAGEEK
jgi:AcrR family transcriptional regulator